jgi:hypothetical protein
VAAATLTSGALAQAQKTAPAASSGKKPNILIIWGDDIGVANISAYSNGLMGYETPNIDRIGHEGAGAGRRLCDQPRAAQGRAGGEPAAGAGDGVHRHIKHP